MRKNINAYVTACLAFAASSKNRLMASSSTTNTRGNCRPTSVAQCSFKFKAPTKRTLFTVPSPIVTKSLAYWGHLAIEHVLGASVHVVDSCAVPCPCIYISGIGARIAASSSLSNKNMLRLALGHKVRRLKTQSNFMSGQFCRPKLPLPRPATPVPCHSDCHCCWPSQLQSPPCCCCKCCCEYSCCG